MAEERTYIAIDLKSFYASVECRERGLDPLTTNLVVADASRTDKTICLAVSPSMKSYGIGGRPRLFEVVQCMQEVNKERQFRAPNLQFAGKTTNDTELKQHPELAADFIAAPPRMAFYIEYSTRIYKTYLRYVAPEDIHVYSIDEVFIDATDYLKLYKKNAHELTSDIIHSILEETGITATAGIGTNLYLAKIAMDIVAKHVEPDKDGVRIAELDEMSYRQKLWNHRPLSDFWRVGHGIVRKLERNELYTMGMIARCSIENEELLYKLFGVNAELLIDHAWGWEPCTMEQIKQYRPETNSLSSGQVLSQPYTVKKARIVTREMADAIALNLVEKRLVADQMTLTICYDAESLSDPTIRKKYRGPVGIDRYGRPVPKHVHGTAHLPHPTSSAKLIIDAVLGIFDNTVNPTLLVRHIIIGTCNVVAEDITKQLQEQQKIPKQLTLFDESSKPDETDTSNTGQLEKERKMQEALLEIKKRFGKNAILKGLNFEEGATAKERNRQIGGHKA